LETRTFATEIEAKQFARVKLDEGLAVYAGTINPHLPKRIIPSGGISIGSKAKKRNDVLRPMIDPARDAG
jgi:hypothetical protein